MYLPNLINLTTDVRNTETNKTYSRKLPDQIVQFNTIPRCNRILIFLIIKLLHLKMFSYAAFTFPRKPISKIKMHFMCRLLFFTK